MTSEQKKQIEDFKSSAAQGETQIIEFGRATLEALLSDSATTSVSFHLARKDDGNITLIAESRGVKYSTVPSSSPKAADACYPPEIPDTQ